jgi:hypothetical protein
MKALRILTLVAGALAFASTASAQRGGVHVHTGGGHYGGYRPVYHGVYYGHPRWNFVVPFSLGYAGGYYMDGNDYYYTPSTTLVPLQTEGPEVTTPPTPPPATEESKPVKLTFGGFARYQDLAARLTAEMNAICLDLHHNYQGNKHFDDAYAEAYSVMQIAKGLKDDKGEHAAIAKRATEAHTKFHHFADDASTWNRQAKKQVGSDGLDEKMARAEAILHHLIYDVGVKEEERGTTGAALPSVDLKEEAPAPGRR